MLNSTQVEDVAEACKFTNILKWCVTKSICYWVANTLAFVTRIHMFRTRVCMLCLCGYKILTPLFFFCKAIRIYSCKSSKRLFTPFLIIMRMEGFFATVHFHKCMVTLLKRTFFFTSVFYYHISLITVILKQLYQNYLV